MRAWHKGERNQIDQVEGSGGSGRSGVEGSELWPCCQSWSSVICSHRAHVLLTEHFSPKKVVHERHSILHGKLFFFTRKNSNFMCYGIVTVHSMQKKIF